MHHDRIKFLTKHIESSLYDYSDAYMLVTGGIIVTGSNENTIVAFTNCAPFKKYNTEINGTFADEADCINIAMTVYNLIEYSHNCSDISGYLWQLKRDEIATNANLCNANSSSFKYKLSLLGNLVANGRKEKVKITVPLKYLSNFWRSLENPLINCEVELSLSWIENCILFDGENINNNGADANAGWAATFKTTDAKLYVPFVTLSTENNAKLVKQLSERYKRSVHWNK